MPGPRAAGPSLGAGEVAVLDAAAALLDAVAPSVWPGLKGFRCAVVYLADDGQYLLNAPSAPDYYEPYRGPAPSWSARSWVTRERRSWEGRPLDARMDQGQHVHYACSAEQTGGHYAFPIVFQDSPQRQLRKERSRLERWLGLFWHELFHVFQESGGLSKGLRPNEITAEGSAAERAGYAESIAAEQDLLVDALEAPVQDRRRLLRQRYLPLRRARHDALRSSGRGSFLDCELVYEASEGTAFYVEELAAAAVAALPEAGRRRADALLAGDARYEAFRGCSGPRLTELRRIDPSQVHRFSYHTGLALALTLDSLRPGWKDSLFRRPGLLFGALEEACR